LDKWFEGKNPSLWVGLIPSNLLGVMGFKLSPMISLEKIRKIDPVATANLTDIELEELRLSLYEMGQLIFEDWASEEVVSKYPDRVFPIRRDEHKI
jgi:hypothetical protein